MLAQLLGRLCQLQMAYPEIAVQRDGLRCVLERLFVFPAKECFLRTKCVMSSIQGVQLACHCGERSGFLAAVQVYDS